MYTYYVYMYICISYVDPLSQYLIPALKPRLQPSDHPDLFISVGGGGTSGPFNMRGQGLFEHNVHEIIQNHTRADSETVHATA